MKKLLFVLVVAMAAAFATAGCQDTARIGQIVALTGNAANGSTLFNSNCARCHGATGAGTPTGPDLRPIVRSRTDSQIAETVLFGVGDMPNFDGTLKNQQIADLIAYLRATFP